MRAPERYAGQLYLSKKSKPVAKTAADGVFCVQLLAYSHPDTHLTMPWRITYFGDAALGFWCHFGAELVPGAALDVVLTRLVLMDGSGRHAGAEIHARVVSVAVLPRAAQVPVYAPAECGIHAALTTF